MKRPLRTVLIVTRPRPGLRRGLRPASLLLGRTRAGAGGEPLIDVQGRPHLPLRGQADHDHRQLPAGDTRPGLPRLARPRPQGGRARGPLPIERDVRGRAPARAVRHGREQDRRRLRGPSRARGLPPPPRQRGADRDDRRGMPGRRQAARRRPDRVHRSTSPWPRRRKRRRSCPPRSPAIRFRSKCAPRGRPTRSTWRRGPVREATGRSWASPSSNAFPFTVNISSGDIGGPSAGLMFALGLYDTSRPGTSPRAGRSRGPGTIGLDGKVGPIGGIADKVEAARARGRHASSSFPRTTWRSCTAWTPGTMKADPGRDLPGRGGRALGAPPERAR